MALLWHRLRRFTALAGQLQLSLHAAHTGFFLILSLFPALVLLLNLLRYTGLDIHSLLGALEGLLPPALLPEAELLIYNTYESTSGALLGLSAVTALWSASRGMQGLITGLRAVLRVPGQWGWLRTRLVSVAYTFAFLLILLLTLFFHVFGTGLVGLLENSPIPFFRFLASVVDLRFFLLVALQSATFTAMFLALPGRALTASQALPGGLLASLGWLIFSQVFSLYVEYFPRYSNLFGSVYALALSMLWLYFCIRILFCGALLSHLLANREK